MLGKEKALLLDPKERSVFFELWPWQEAMIPGGCFKSSLVLESLPGEGGGSPETAQHVHSDSWPHLTGPSAYWAFHCLLSASNLDASSFSFWPLPLDLSKDPVPQKHFPNSQSPQPKWNPSGNCKWLDVFSLCERESVLLIEYSSKYMGKD